MTDEHAVDLSGGGRGLRLDRNDPVARELVAVIHAGDLDSVRRLLAEHPGLAGAQLVDDINLSGRPLTLPSDDEPKIWPPRITIAGVRVYLTSVRALPTASASKQGSLVSSEPCSGR